jgi:hypothetical protein
MPSADFVVLQGQPVRAALVEGIPVRSDLLFSDEKGNEKPSFEKRNAKALQKLRPALQRVLHPGETVLYVARALSPLSAIEQVTAAWWIRMLAACAVIAANKRVLFFPVNRDGSWRQSVRAASWGDLGSVEKTGVLVN